MCFNISASVREKESNWTSYRAGRVSLKAMRPSGKIDSFLGLLAGKSKKVATLDEINEAAASGWAGQK